MMHIKFYSPNLGSDEELLEDPNMMELGTESGLCSAFLPLCDLRFTTGSSFADKKEAEDESAFSESLLLSFFFFSSFFEFDLGVTIGSFRGETPPPPSSSSSPSVDPLVNDCRGDDRLRLEFSSLK